MKVRTGEFHIGEVKKPTTASKINSLSTADIFSLMTSFALPVPWRQPRCGETVSYNLGRRGINVHKKETNEIADSCK